LFFLGVLSACFTPRSWASCSPPDPRRGQRAATWASPLLAEVAVDTRIARLVSCLRCTGDRWDGPSRRLALSASCPVSSTCPNQTKKNIKRSVCLRTVPSIQTSKTRHVACLPLPCRVVNDSDNHNFLTDEDAGSCRPRSEELRGPGLLADFFLSFIGKKKFTFKP
jgi:hypothetical protein